MAETSVGYKCPNCSAPLTFLPGHDKVTCEYCGTELEVKTIEEMYAAKEVGGDFYDFFMIDDRHLAVLVADVSGKGITAALYMMNSKALLKELIQSGLEPAAAFAQANREL